MTPAVDGVWLSGTGPQNPPFVGLHVAEIDYIAANDPKFDIIGETA